MIELFEHDGFIDTGFDTINLKEFKLFLNQCWVNRKRYLDEESEQTQQRFLQFDGSQIKARNYVGFICYNGIQLQIYPKICRGIEDKSQILNQVLY